LKGPAAPMAWRAIVEVGIEGAVRHHTCGYGAW